jgi:homoserine O-acetyltransferase
MCSYRSPRALDDRFGRREDNGSGFAVTSWLDHHGRSLAARFDAASYVTLTEAMDRHDVGRGRGGDTTSLSRINVPVLVMGVSSDMLYSATEIHSLGSSIPGASVAWIDTPHGHDGFLIEADEVNRVVTDFRRRIGRSVVACAVG